MIALCTYFREACLRLPGVSPVSIAGKAQSSARKEGAVAAAR